MNSRGNFLLLPGSPAPVWDALAFLSSRPPETQPTRASLATQSAPRDNSNVENPGAGGWGQISNITIAAVVGERGYQGQWRELAMVMHAARQLVGENEGEGEGEGEGKVAAVYKQIERALQDGNEGGEGSKEGGANTGVTAADSITGSDGASDGHSVTEALAMRPCHVTLLTVGWNDGTASIASDQQALLQALSRHLTHANFSWQHVSDAQASPHLLPPPSLSSSLSSPSYGDVGADGNTASVSQSCDATSSQLLALLSSDVLVYTSAVEVPELPPVITQALLLGRIVVAPDLLSLQPHLSDAQTAFLYRTGSTPSLFRTLQRVLSSPPSRLSDVRVAGRRLALSLGARQAVVQLAGTVERVVELGSEVKPPMSASELEGRADVGWMWGPAGRELERMLQAAFRHVDGGGAVSQLGEEGRDELSGVFDEGVHDGNIGIVGATEQRWLEEQERSEGQLLGNRTRESLLMREMDEYKAKRELEEWEKQAAEEAMMDRIEANEVR